MKPDIGQPTAGTRVRIPRGMPGGIFRRGKPTRELFLVKFAFWAVVVGFILLVAFVLWRLATNEPSHFSIDSGD